MKISVKEEDQTRNEIQAEKIMASLKEGSLTKELANEMLNSINYELKETRSGFIARKISHDTKLDLLMEGLGFEKVEVPSGKLVEIEGKIDGVNRVTFYKTNRVPYTEKISKKNLIKILRATERW